LAQLIMGKCCSATTMVDVSHMADGQRAGLSLFGSDAAWIGVVQENGRRTVTACSDGAIVEGAELAQQALWLKAVCDDGAGSLFYSLDGESYLALGKALAPLARWSETRRLALFTYNVAAPHGFVDFDWFHMQHDGPQAG
jgi:beta-xylosidase